ncbi:pseudouridine synthase [Marinicauda pacifica]|uniref:RluA family pseudouridine synthase n=1 Tax=Marinicauda pacifica TaxID=1133559 RepID=A0A4S2H740_9PROT|nr:RluA family pseudouridine synthase [Marinicauda pacifica]TGY91655.1 RluA family pseudouridine synthase [Marinicauda pacifica]GGE51594.1 pseudouridine synthase [Marinicauda pacifica]
MSGVQNLEVTRDEADIRLDRWFKRRFPHVPFGMVAKLARKGQVRVDGGRAKPDDRLQPGQIVRVPPLPDPGETKPELSLSREDATFARSLVIYQDKELIALNKPPGLAVQGGSKITHHVDRLLDAFGRGEERPRLVHRLDKDTSGVLIVAKTAQSAKRLAKLFQGRDLKKTYWAICLGVPVPKAGEVKGFIKKAVGDHADREQMVGAAHGEEGAQYALTRYAVAEEAGRRVSWVVLRPETGRTHQLRVHMAATGNAILGDGKYTCDVPVPEGLSRKLHLHARKLEIPRPGQKPLIIEAPMPEHMKQTFEALGFDPRADLIFVEEALT